METPPSIVSPPTSPIEARLTAASNFRHYGHNKWGHFPWHTTMDIGKDSKTAGLWPSGSYSSDHQRCQLRWPAQRRSAEVGHRKHQRRSR
jgi:hypothetical protein